MRFPDSLTAKAYASRNKFAFPFVCLLPPGSSPPRPPWSIPTMYNPDKRLHRTQASWHQASESSPTSSDDFEVSIFLTETSTRHSLLYKHKHFRDTTQTRLTSNSAKLTGASREAPIDVDDHQSLRADEADTAPPIQLLREDSDDDVVALHDIPTIAQPETPTAADGTPPAISRTSKRRRESGGTLPRGDDGSGSEHENPYLPNSDESEDDDGGLFVNQDDEDEDDHNHGIAPRPAKRRKNDASASEHEEGRDDKKKLAMDISYEGFAIYGRVLCLVVKRREGSSGGKGKGVAAAARAADGRGNNTGPSSAAPGGQAMMENWITSTQMPEAVASGLLDAS